LRESTDKRQRILEAARARFRYYGVQKTTMQEIARDAKVAVGTVYLYFKNKDDLLVAGTEEFVRMHRDSAERILSSRQPADRKLLDYVVSRFRVTEEIRTGPRHAAELARAVLRVRPDRITEEGEMMAGTIVQILQEGCAQGLFYIQNPEADTEIFLFSIAYFYPNALMELMRIPTESELVKVVDWFLGVWKRKQ
jgi:AcrR family transcriptional regulator